MKMTKTYIIVIISLLLCISALVLGQTVKMANQTDEYTKERNIAKADMVVFNKAIDDVVGINYEPIKVATKKGAKRNYRFLATATPFGSQEQYLVNIFICIAENGEPELGSIEIVK